MARAKMCVRYILMAAGVVGAGCLASGLAWEAASVAYSVGVYVGGR